jgi:hypothetical protein
MKEIADNYDSLYDERYKSEVCLMEMEEIFRKIENRKERAEKRKSKNLEKIQKEYDIIFAKYNECREDYFKYCKLYQEAWVKNRNASIKFLEILNK